MPLEQLHNEFVPLTHQNLFLRYVTSNHYERKTMKNKFKFSLLAALTMAFSSNVTAQSISAVNFLDITPMVDHQTVVTALVANTGNAPVDAKLIITGEFGVFDFGKTLNNNCNYERVLYEQDRIKVVFNMPPASGCYVRFDAKHTVNEQAVTLESNLYFRDELGEVNNLTDTVFIPASN